MSLKGVASGIWFMKFLLTCSLGVACSSSPDDDISFVQTALTMHAGPSTKKSKLPPKQEPSDSYEDLLIEQFKRNDISDMTNEDLEVFQAKYEWGQRLTNFMIVKDHTNASVDWTPKDADQVSDAERTKPASFKIKGFRPKGDGPFPVYVSITGDYCDYDGGAMLDMVTYMAKKGYFALAVQYDNGRFCADYCASPGKCEYHREGDTPLGEGDFYTDHQHYFNSTTANAFFGSVTVTEKARGLQNALDTVCDSVYADCSKGVALSGFSQGAWVGSALGLIDTRITAMFWLGVGLMEDYDVTDHSPGHELVIFKQSCLMDESMSKHVPRAKRRYVDGARDTLIDYKHDALQLYSGYKCDNFKWPVNCIQSDGSGYYIVSPTQFKKDDKKLEHEYPTNWAGGMPLNKTLAGHNFFSNTRPIDKEGKLLPSFKHGKEPWCFRPCFDWLAKAALTQENSAPPRLPKAVILMLTVIWLDSFRMYLKA